MLLIIYCFPFSLHKTNAFCHLVDRKLHNKTYILAKNLRVSIYYLLSLCLLVFNSFVSRQLCYLGSPEGGGDETRQASMRTCVEVAASDNVSLFLEEIGFRLESQVSLLCF